MNEKFALAFSGGGAKGAWQLGVWRALEERGLKACCVSGTSVGALNAVLYAQGDYQKAEVAWKSITRDKLLGIDEVIHQLTDFPTFAEWANKARAKFSEITGKEVPEGVAGFCETLDKFSDECQKDKLGEIGAALNDLPILQKDGPVPLPGGIPIGGWPSIIVLVKQLLEAKLKRFENSGFLSADGIRKLIAANVDLAGRSEWITAYATAHCKEDDAVRYFKLFPNDGWDEKAVEDALCASSAIPYLFRPIEIEGKSYSDGGFDLVYNLTDKTLCSGKFDNAPVEPLARCSSELGFRNVLLLGLNRDEILSRPDFGNVRVMPLLPSKDLGGLIDGCLDFDPRHVQGRIDQGYEDAQKWLDVFSDCAENDAKLKELWDRIATADNEYLNADKKIGIQFRASSELGKTIDSFNEIVMRDDGSGELDIAVEERDLEDRLTEHAAALLDAQQREETDRLVDALVDESRTNAEQIGKFTMDAVAALSPVESRSNDLLEQGFFGRLWHSFTGSNQRQTATSTLNLAQAQYASLRLIQKVQKEQLLQFEFASMLQSKITRLAGDIAKVEENANLHFRDVYRSMAICYCKTRKELVSHARRIDELEKNMRVVEWITSAKVRSFGGRQLMDMDPGLRFIVAALDFYMTVSGDVTPKRRLQFVAGLDALGLRKEPITLRSILGAATSPGVENSVLDFKQDFKREPVKVIGLGADWLPALIDRRTAALPGVDTPMPAELLADELFFSLKVQGWRPRTSVESERKQQLISCCSRLRKIVEEGVVAYGKDIPSRIDQLEDAIRRYTFRVYLVGPFSCGKSSLLNRWLGIDELLPTGIAPETAVSTELRYGEEDRMELVPLREGDPVETLTGVGASNMAVVRTRANRRELLNVVLYLNHNRLKIFSDLCLVDLPGLSSANPAHEAAINRFIQEGAPGIFCVPMADGTIHEDGLAFLRKMERFRSAFNLLLTKADEKAESDHAAIVAATSSKVKQVLGLSDEDMIVGKVSKNSNDGFVQMLDEFQKQKDAYLTGRFGGDFRAIADEVAAPLRKALAADFRNPKLEEALAKIEETQKALPELMEDVLADVRHGARSATSRIINKVKQSVQARRGEFLAIAKGGGDPSAEVASQIKSSVGYEAQGEMMDIVDRANRKAGELFGERLSFSVDDAGADAGGGPVAFSLNEGDGDSIVGKLLAGAGAGGAGFWLGNIVLPGLGGLIGTALGSLVGCLFGRKNKIEEERRIEAEFTASLNRACDDARSAIDRMLADAVERYGGDLRTALGNKLGRLKEQMEQLKSESEGSRSEWEAKQSERKAALDAVEAVLAEAEKE